MPDGKTFLEAGGVVDEIVDVRAEEASVFAGPFARRSSQRLIATRKTRSLACQSAATGTGVGTGVETKVQQKNRAAAAALRLLWGPTRHTFTAAAMCCWTQLGAIIRIMRIEAPS